MFLEELRLLLEEIRAVWKVATAAATIEAAIEQLVIAATGSLICSEQHSENSSRAASR
jgi:hypothetical protein